MNQRTFIVVGIIIVIGVVIGGLFFFRRGNQAPAADQPLIRLPDLTFDDYTGTQVSFSQFVGKPLVVNAWASWCPFCTKELADFAAVQKSNPGIVFIAVNRGESHETAQTFTNTLRVTPALRFLLDPDDRFYKAIGGFSMPETIFVDTEGNIVYHKRGPMDESEVQDRLHQLFKQ